jgi:hypothetical protein
MLARGSFADDYNLSNAAFETVYPIECKFCLTRTIALSRVALLERCELLVVRGPQS